MADRGFRASGQRADLQDSLAHAFATGLDSGFVVAGVIGLVAGAAVWLLVAARQPGVAAPVEPSASPS